MKSSACWLPLSDNTSLSHKNNMAAKSIPRYTPEVPYTYIVRVYVNQ